MSLEIIAAIIFGLILGVIIVFAALIGRGHKISEL